MIIKEHHIKNGLIILILSGLAIVGMMIVNSCNTFKPIPFNPDNYKDVLFPQWKADNEEGVINYTLLYSSDQNNWTGVKTYKSGKGSYLDTINYLAGYYRIKVNLQSGADSSNIVSVK